jgi:hypothetical protein
VIVVETQAEHNIWLKKQQSYYAQNHPEEVPVGEQPLKTAVDTTKKITMK